MPNWCENNLALRHADSAMIQRARDAYANGTFFNEFVPVPEDLHITAGKLGDPILQEELEAKEQLNRDTHGYANWYDFCVNEWGTKWDVGGDDSLIVAHERDLLTVIFDSAWAPPIEFYRKMEVLGFEVEAYYHEGGMAFVGSYIDGDDDYMEYGDLTSDTARAEIGETLDDMFGISEQLANYEEEENQEIDLDNGLSATNE
jgi:hypothetical protein